MNERRLLSKFANPFKVAQNGRGRAMKFSLEDDQQLRSSLWTLSGFRLVCHCGLQQSCHADALISAFADEFPEAFDRNDTSASPPPTSMQLNYFEELKEEPHSSEGSSADEGAKPPGAGWTGTGKPMQVGIGYTVRDFCDGQSLASPRRWPVTMRRYSMSDP